MYLNLNKQGDAYPALQSNPAPGLVYFPDELISVFYPSDKRAAGFVTIEHDGEKVTSCVWNDEAYQKWAEENPEVESIPQPTLEERTAALEAAMLSMMGDV